MASSTKKLKYVKREQATHGDRVGRSTIPCGRRVFSNRTNIRIDIAMDKKEGGREGDGGRRRAREAEREGESLHSSAPPEPLALCEPALHVLDNMHVTLVFTDERFCSPE